MATAQQIRDLIMQTTTGSVRPRVPRDVRDEVCRYAGRRRAEGANELDEASDTADHGCSHSGV